MSSSTWAAIAALFSAIAAWLSWNQQRKNALESIRPNIVPGGWSFSKGEDTGKFTIRRISNFGSGPALNIRSLIQVKGKKVGEGAALPHDPIPFLPAGSDTPVNWKGYIYWEYGLKFGDSEVLMPLDLKIFFLDIHANSYEVNYYLTAFKEPGIAGGIHELSPGLYLCSINTKFTCRKLYLFQNKLRKLSGHKVYSDITSKLRKLPGHKVYSDIMGKLQRHNTTINRNG